MSVKRLGVVGSFAAVWSLSAAASADVSSWIYVGGGAADLRRADQSAQMPVTLQMDAGFGSAPRGPLAFGFVFKTLTYLDYGTDLGLALRTTTSGYSLGNWGLALDLGAAQRFWGSTNHTLPSASLSFGLPWGLTLASSVASDFDATQSVVVTLGIDWARLTAHRTAGNGWWRNYRLPLASDEVAKR